MINALTIDVEDYFHVTAFAGSVSPANWDDYPARVELGSRKILKTLGDRRATFFVLGWVADRHPELVRELIAAGHEIASHGYWHQPVYAQTHEQFRADVRRSKRALEDLTGRAVTAYRAPCFSIPQSHAWAFEVLVEEGYAIDSSMAAGRRRSIDRGGEPFRLATPSGELWEYPLPAMKLGPVRFPVGGGGYFRLLPYPVTRSALRAINRAGRPFCAYLHPWEFDPDQPRLHVPMTAYARHYLNLHRTLPRFERLVNDFAFDTLTGSLKWWRDSRPTLELRPAPAVGRNPRTPRPAAAAA